MRSLLLFVPFFSFMVLPAQQAPKSMHEVYYQYLENLDRHRVWSLLDARWYEYSVKDPSGWGAYVDGSLVKGTRLLNPGKVEEYQVWFTSDYQGRPKQRWKWWPGREQPNSNGVIYTEDEVQVAWELRASKGLKLLSEPQAPRGILRYGEPYVTTFRVRLGDDKTDPEPELELYVCLYHEGKLVKTYYSLMILNAPTAVVSDQETEYMRGRYGKVSEEIVTRQRRQSEEQHLTAPDPNEVITDLNTPAPARRPSPNPK